LGTDGGGNIDSDPLFVDADGGDDIVGTGDDNVRLLPCSPCIDAGDNSVVTVGIDLDGNERIVNGTVDMGAYETSNNEPFICLSTSQVRLEAYESDTNACGKMFSMFSIRNGGGGTLHWTIAGGGLCDWLTISPMGGSSTGETDEVMLIVDTSGLAVGDYNCDLTISADGALNSPETVHVVLEVLDLAPSIPISLAYEAQCYGYAYATTWIFYPEDRVEDWDTCQDSSINDKSQCQAYVDVSYEDWPYGSYQSSLIKTEVEGCYGGYGGRLVSNIQGYGVSADWKYGEYSYEWPVGGYGSGHTSLAGIIDIGEGLPMWTPDIITLTADAIVSGDDPSRWDNWDWCLKIWDDDPGTPLMQLGTGNTSAELSVLAGQMLNFEFYVEAEQDDWLGGRDSTIQIDLGVIIPNVADVNGDDRVDLADFGIVSGRWMEAGCNEGNDFCNSVDIDQMGDVGLGDLFILAGNWLAGVPGPV